MNAEQRDERPAGECMQVGVQECAQWPACAPRGKCAADERSDDVRRCGAPEERLDERVLVDDAPEEQRRVRVRDTVRRRRKCSCCGRGEVHDEDAADRRGRPGEDAVEPLHLTKMTTYDLFGGAMTLVAPPGLVDAALVRQVPDTQEVLLSRDSDVSLIVEVLQQVGEGTSQEALEHAVRFHFDSLAHDNDARAAEVAWVEVVGSGSDAAAAATRPALLGGTQRVCKFGKDELEDTVFIWVAVWRVPSKRIDVVLSVNSPHTPGAAEALFRGAATSLRIVDYGLFA